MKLNKISALCALTCAVLSGQAMAAMTAAEQTIVNDANTNGRVVYISGASAVKSGFTAIVASMFTGSTIRFAEGASSNYLAVAGKLTSAAGTWAAGSNAIVIYRVKGGSAFGVDPVARNTAIESLAVTSAACGATGAGTSASPYICATDTRTPDAGVSDVAPALFHGAYNTEGEVAAPALTGTELALLTSTPIYGIEFGLPVTKNVGLINLNKATVAAVMTGNVGTWNAVDATQTGDILICRRVPGSGTQAVTNMYYGNYPCDTGSALNVPADRDASTAWDPVARKFTVTPGTGGLVVIENSSSGEVKNCLDKAVTGGTYGTFDRSGNPVTVDMGAGGHKAIGVLSMDSLANSTTTGNWQFRSLDGAGTITWDNTAAAPVTSGTGRFPTLASYMDGTWDMQGWVSFNMPARTTGNKAALLNTFANKAQDPTVLAGIAALKNVAAAIPGGTYSGAQVLRSAYVNGNQCAPLNRNY